MRAKRAADDGLGVAEPGLHGRVLARRALAVVLVADGHPALAGLVVVLGDVGERLASRRRAGRCPTPASPVKALMAPRNRLPQMFSRWPRYLSHGPGGRDVVGGALALGLDQHGQVDEVLAVPGRERLEQLEAVAGGRHHHLDAGAVGRRRDEAALARREALGRAAPRRPARRGWTVSPGVVGQRVGERVEVDACRPGPGRPRSRVRSRRPACWRSRRCASGSCGCSR